jgi:hypothetical protein
MNSEINIVRLDPRKDMEQVKELIAKFEYRMGNPIDIVKFEKELNKRVKDLSLRNGNILAKIGEKVVGAGFFTIWYDILGTPNCIIHDVIVEKENGFIKGIEEAVMHEMFSYLKKTLKIDTVNLFANKRDGNFQSLLMKLGFKKSSLVYYEKEI